MSLRPIKYAHTDDLAGGSWLLVPFDGGTFTLARVIGFQKWYPLTSRADPSVLVWETWQAANAHADQDGATLLEWPHWGLMADGGE